MRTDYRALQRKYGRLFEKQLEIEEKYKNSAMERAAENFDKKKESGDFGASSTAGVIESVVRDEVIAGLTEGLMKKRCGVQPAYNGIVTEMAEIMGEDFIPVVAVATVSRILSSLVMKKNDKGTLSAVTWTLANVLKDEFILRKFEHECEKEDKYAIFKSTMDGMTKRVGSHYKMAYLSARIHNEGIDYPTFDTHNMQLLAGRVLAIVIELLGEWVTLETNGMKSANKSDYTTLEPTETFLDIVEQSREYIMSNAIRKCACVIPPRRWESALECSGYYGVLTGSAPFIRSQELKGNNAIRKQQKKMLQEANLSALFKIINGIQETPFRINRKVLEVIREVVKDGKGEFAGVPRLKNHPLPEKLPETASEEEVLQARAVRFEIHKKNRKISSKIWAFNSIYDAALLYEEFDRIYFPHNLDYRGRVYPVNTDIHPQGSDMMKGLLEFADPAECKSEDDVKWLAIAGATHAAYQGMDKKTFAERIQWIEDNHTNIIASADDPLNYTWWWEVSQDEHPVSFLAFCFEWQRLEEYKRAHNGSMIGFKCHAAIPFDGSCSGIQHYAAILRDEIGGKAVNLLNTGKVEDIYREVAEVVNKAIEKDFLTGDEEQQFFATVWKNYAITAGHADGKLTRKVVKRPVMTFGYGSDVTGFTDQLGEDIITPFTSDANNKHIFEQDGKDCSRKAARYLAVHIKNSLSRTVRSAVVGRDYLKEITKLVTKSGQTMMWKTPLGFPVCQLQFKSEDRSIQLPIAGIRRRITLSRDSEELNKAKIKTSIAPNFIHSQDAAHLQLVVGGALAEGITNFQLIHDSFGTDLGNSNRFFHIIREQFVGMYANKNVLGSLVDQVDWLIDEKLIDDIPDTPSFGGLNVSSVLESQYAFS